MTTRRTKIRAPKKTVADDGDFDASWNDKLSPAIGEIYAKSASRRSFEELYRTAYYLVLQKHGKRLYDNVKDQIRRHLEGEVDQTLRPLIQSESSDGHKASPSFLKVVETCWQDNCVCMRMTCDILMYLDRAYVREAKVPLMYDAGLSVFRDAILYNSTVPIGPVLFDIITSEVTKDREGQVIDRMAIKATVTMLEALPDVGIESDSVYSSRFEPLFLTATEAYFIKASSSFLESDPDGFEYINKTDAWLKDEGYRCTIYLSNRTLEKLVSLVERILITDRIQTVMALPGTGFQSWVDSDKLDALSLLFRLVNRVDNTHQVIRDFLSQRILTTGKEINQGAQQAWDQSRASKGARKPRPAPGGASGGPAASLQSPTDISIQWVEQVIGLKQKYDRFLATCFDRNRGIQSTIEDAFAQSVNDNPRAAEFLSLFLDEHLKKSVKGKSDQEVEEILENAITVFRYVSDKDQFETYYKMHLAKRLLNARSVSDDVERSMISKISREVGTAFTSKLEGMFKDMRISRDINGEFKGERGDIQVNVLTSTFWPMQTVTQSKCILPPPVEEARGAFEAFYLGRHTGRVLAWNMSMGTADVRARFRKRTHEINMSTMAMCILMLFNELPPDTALTYDDIAQATQIPAAELARHLQSIAVAPKTRLLIKEPMSREINPTDKFYFNDKFESPLARIKVLAVSAASKVENDKERKETMGKIDQARKYEADAAIVRIMKMRKRLAHVQLVTEVTKQLATRFKPDPIMIKHEIDTLLEQEYIERDSEERNVYVYLA